MKCGAHFMPRETTGELLDAEPAVEDPLVPRFVLTTAAISLTRNVGDESGARGVSPRVSREPGESRNQTREILCDRARASTYGPTPSRALRCPQSFWGAGDAVLSAIGEVRAVKRRFISPQPMSVVS
jgi:hypothetical protein